MVISLTGFMGCGKSSAGRELARLLDCPFVDLDNEIELREGMSIPEIFSSKGEKGFREAEFSTLSQLSCLKENNTCVLSLGGGTLMTAGCEKIVNEKTFCVYLRSTAETLVANLQGTEGSRPMLEGRNLRDRIEELMALRASTYERCAAVTVDLDGLSNKEAAEKILRQLPLR